MELPVLGFIPPLVGLEEVFNTFRLGRKFASLPVGSEVLLIDEKRKVAFGRAEVLDVTTGPLSALCAVYGSENHTQLGKQGDHAEQLYQVLTRIYGPHIVQPTKLATCIKLRRLE